MEIYLIRHGETISNQQKRYQGWSESALSERGMRQAELTAFFLAKEKPVRLYCSDLKRAVVTATAIGKSCGLVPVVSTLLREVHFGRWEGHTFGEIKNLWSSDMNDWLQDPFTHSAPGGETLEEVYDRMRTFLENLEAGTPEGSRVAVVTHGGSIRALLYQMLEIDKKGFWDIHIGNASVSLIRKEQGRFKVIYYDRSDHLDDE